MFARSESSLPFFDRMDRYVMRLFWSSYLVAFVFFFGAFMVIDLFSKADDFLERAKSMNLASGEVLKLVARYYAFGAPAVFLQVAPFVTVIGCIVSVARLIQNNELIPILMSGRSVFRTLRPLFACALSLTVMMILVQELLSPKMGEKRLYLGEYLRRGRTTYTVPHVLKDEQGNLWSAVEFRLADGTVESARLVRRVDGGTEFAFGLKDLFYDRSQNPPGWRSKRPFEIKVDIGGAELSTRSADFVPSSLTPEHISANMMEAFDLSFRDLGMLIATTANERNKPRYQVLLHYHITFPLTNVLLMLLVLPFVVKYEKRSMLLGLAAAFFLCGVYFGVDFALRTLGEERIHPVLAAWFTPIFFGSLGISLFDGIRT